MDQNSVSMLTKAKSFDKILKIRLSEMSMASSSFLSAIIKEFRLQIKDDIEGATTTMGGIENIISKVEQIANHVQHLSKLVQSIANNVQHKAT